MVKWIARNAINLIIVGAIIAFLIYFYWGKSLSEMGRNTFSVFLVIAGLGFVIFIHELGHFLAAKACGVRVSTFSIGFGPAIPGLHFTYGETRYKIAQFPIGGYVQMLGQEDPGVSPDEEEEPDDPRSFKNKPVGQRMIIISAGVVMNVILGLVCFIYAYRVGKPELAPRVGAIEAGSPADQAGLPAGSILKRIESHPTSLLGKFFQAVDDLGRKENMEPTFMDLLFSCSFATPDETTIDLEYESPTGEKGKATVRPWKRKSDTNPVIGAELPYGLVLVRTEGDKAPAVKGTPAHDAGFKPGDRLEGVWSENEKEYIAFTNGWHVATAEYKLRRQTVTFNVKRGEENKRITVGPQYFYTFKGLRMQMGEIRTIGADAPLEVRENLRVGDLITAVDGNDSFDPMHLPDLIMDKAGQPVQLTIRGRDKPVMVIPIKDRGTWNAEKPMHLNSPVGIPGLGITYSVHAVVTEDPPQDTEAYQKGVRKGDIIKRVKFKRHPQGSETMEVSLPADDKRSLESHQWPFVFWSLQDGERTVELTIQGKEEPVTLTMEKDEAMPRPDRGMLFDYERILVRADSMWDAILFGFLETKETVGQVYLSIQALVTGNVSVEKLYGPLRLSKVTYLMAEEGLDHLILILGIISVNLAVINFLPIPVLDGGHMLFLIVEKIRGKPASERALIIANSIGLALIVCLMVFVIYIDIRFGSF